MPPKPTTSWSGQRRSFPAATRRRILARQPWCAHCRTNPSTIADHIVPAAEGGTDHESNGQGLCTACHDRKTAAEQTRGRNRRTGARRAQMKPRAEPHPGTLAP